MGDFYTNPVRHPEDTGVGHIRRTVTFSQAGIGGTLGIPIGALEAGAVPLHVQAYVETAFNAGTTNTVTVGTAATADGFATSAGIAPGTTGYKASLSGVQTGIPLAADTVVYVKYTQSGTAATTGKLMVLLTFVNKREAEGIPFPAN